MTTLNEIKQYLRSFRERVIDEKREANGEVFTPTALVQEILDEFSSESFTDPTKTFLDPSCGDGQFLSEVIIRKMENGNTYEQALSTTFGVVIILSAIIQLDPLITGRSSMIMFSDGGLTCTNQIGRAHV